MELDAYSICPGGTGQKLKFCCPPERLEELKKVYKLIEGQQNMACLGLLDSLLEKTPDKPCLMALRCMVLESLPDKEEEFCQQAERFGELFPENPIATVESLHALMQREHRRVFTKLESVPETQREIAFREEQDTLRGVLETVSRRLEKVFQNNDLYGRVLNKMPLFIRAMLANRCFNAAVAWTSLVLTIKGDFPAQEELAYLLNDFYTNTDIPLALRTGLTLRHAPEGAAWKEAFEENFELARRVRWSEAEEGFRKLAETNAEAAKASELWFNLATIAEWHCDLKQAGVYWKKFLASEGLNFYDALEAQIHAGSLDYNPLGDALEGFVIKHRLYETDKILEAMLSSPILQQLEKPEHLGERGNALVACFELLDAPKPATLEGVAVEDIPLVSGAVLLWGRQTDREPYLEVVNVLQSSVDYVEEELNEAFGKFFVGQPDKQSVGQMSVTLDSIQRRIYIPPKTPFEDIERLRNEHFRSVVLNHWINFPLGILGRKSAVVAAKAAATDPAMRIKLEAAIYFLRQLVEAEHLDLAVLDEMRQQLGLEALPAIPAEAMGHISPLFYDQVKPEGVKAEDMDRIVMKGSLHGVLSIPEEFLLAAARNEDVKIACRMEALLTLLRTKPMSEDAPKWLEEGYAICHKANASDAMFDVAAMTLAVHDGDLDTAVKKIQHIHEKHPQDRNAMAHAQQMEAFLSDLMTRYQAMRGSANVDAVMGGGTVLGEPEAPSKPTGIWTPDSPNDGGDGGKPGGSGLWLPD